MLALRESAEAQSKLDALLLGCFSVQKLYGRDPGSVESINQVFHSILGRYQSDYVIRAFEIWMERSPEFPTPADIVGLIRRKGKPPLSREMFIAISRKDGEDRTGDDWQYLRDYEAEQLENHSEFADPRKDFFDQQEMTRLRSQVRDLRLENERLAILVHETRVAKGIERPHSSIEQKVRATAKVMRDEGASEFDIASFLRLYRMEAA